MYGVEQNFKHYYGLHRLIKRLNNWIQKYNLVKTVGALQFQNIARNIMLKNRVKTNMGAPIQGSVIENSHS